MNISTSECSSGCESGWTMYLDQSSNSTDQFGKGDCGIVNEGSRKKGANVDEENENLSMLSDASSWPRHFHEDEDSFYDTGNFFKASSVSEKIKKSKLKKEIKEHRGKQHNLDDTASSPVLSISKKNKATSNNQAAKEHVTQGFSATHFKHSVPGKSASENSGGLQGRKWQ